MEYNTDCRSVLFQLTGCDVGAFRQGERFATVRTAVVVAAMRARLAELAEPIIIAKNDRDLNGTILLVVKRIDYVSNVTRGIFNLLPCSKKEWFPGKTAPGRSSSEYLIGGRAVCRELFATKTSGSLFEPVC